MLPKAYNDLLPMYVTVLCHGRERRLIMELWNLLTDGSRQNYSWTSMSQGTGLLKQRLMNISHFLMNSGQRMP